MNDVFLSNIFLFVLASVLAVLEILVEGKNRARSSKHLEPYQLVMFLLVALIFSFPYFFGKDLTVPNFAKSLSLFFIFIVLWDFLWFILNPAYPLKSFRKEHIWWHKQWLLGLPASYYWSLCLSLILLFPVMVYTGDYSLFHFWLSNIIMFILEICLATIVTMDVLRIDSWEHHRRPISRTFRGS